MDSTPQRHSYRLPSMETNKKRVEKQMNIIHDLTIPDAITGKEKIAGHFRADKIYLTVRKTKIHFFKKKQGYAISEEIIRKLNALECKGVIIKEIRADDSFRFWKTTFEQWKHAILMQEGEYELQRLIPLKEMFTERVGF